MIADSSNFDCCTIALTHDGRKPYARHAGGLLQSLQSLEQSKAVQRVQFANKTEIIHRIVEFISAGSRGFYPFRIW